MKPSVYLIMALLFSFCDNNTDNPLRDVDKLCDFQGIASAATTDVCLSDQFIIRLENLQGAVRWSPELNAFTVTTTMNGSYDCQALSVICTSSDLSPLQGRDVIYSETSFFTPVLIDHPLPASICI